MERFESLRTDALLLRRSFDGIRATIQVVRPSAFTYVEQNFLGILGLVLLVGILPDAFFRHLLVPHRYWIVNTAFDLLELLTALWCCGAFAAMVSSPHELLADVLRVRFGAFASVDVPLEQIVSVDVAAASRGMRRKHRNAHVFALAKTPLVRLELDRDIRISSYPFVRPRVVRTIFIPSDRPDELVDLVRGRTGASA